MALQQVKLVQDEDCNWYVIPDILIDEFRRDDKNDEMIDSGEFWDKWAKYQTGGDVNNIQLYADL